MYGGDACRFDYDCEGINSEGVNSSVGLYSMDGNSIFYYFQNAIMVVLFGVNIIKCFGSMPIWE
jgi:hypothetical protein